MRLVLSPPAPLDGVQLVWGPLQPRPDDFAAWCTRMLGEELPATARLEVRGFETRPTRTGWPCELVSGVVVIEERVVQARLVACYRFLEYAGAALAIAPTSDILDAMRDALLATFETGRPDWGADGTVVCLRDLVVAPR